MAGILLYFGTTRKLVPGKKNPDPFQASQIRMTRSQSGQIHVGPLLIPHLFSSKHSGQIWKPQGQFQQYGFCRRQQLHT